MREQNEPKTRHITEFSDILRKVESVFDPKNPLHLKEKMANQYLEDPDSLQPEQLKDFETHLAIPCEKCAKMIQNKRKLF